jgi:hypothetical protein
MQAAAQENARKEWQALTSVERYCLNAGLQRSGNDINRLIQQGIAPSDQRLQNLQNTCMQITARDLNSDIECTVSTTGGTTYVSRCRQAFARLDPRGNFIEIDLETAITDTFAGRKPEIGTFQRPDAANRWREQQAAGGDRTRVVTPSFSCEKAKRPVELAICNSYDLSRYDREYADLWTRAKPMDPKGDIAKQLAARTKTRAACNAHGTHSDRFFTPLLRPNDSIHPPDHHGRPLGCFHFQALFGFTLEREPLSRFHRRTSRSKIKKNSKKEAECFHRCTIQPLQAYMRRRTHACQWYTLEALPMKKKRRIHACHRCKRKPLQACQKCACRV